MQDALDITDARYEGGLKIAISIKQLHIYSSFYMSDVGLTPWNLSQFLRLFSTVVSSVFLMIFN